MVAGDSEGGDKNLARTGFEVLDVFKELTTSTVEASKSFDIIDQQQRFDLWATNIGLHQKGHASLDYRFRDAPEISQFCQSLLEDLVGALEILKSELLGEAEVQSQGSEDGSTGEIDLSDYEDSLDDYDDETTASAAFTSAVDCIDRLFRLTIKVRDPSTRTGLSKGYKFRKIDEDSGLDLYDCFAEQHIDESFVREILRGYGSPQSSTGEPDSYLVLRLAKANNQRRRQFAYWSHHKLKLAERTEKARKTQERQVQLPTLSHAPSATEHSVPTTATHFDQKKVSIDDETRSNISTISMTIAERADWSEKFTSFPDPPVKYLDEEDLKEFECPYCYTICSAKLLNKRRWRAHLLKDLRPYVCTHEKCNTSSQIYDSINDWISHEYSHYEKNIDSTGVLLRQPRPCPFCTKSLPSVDGAASHIAMHLVRIALFAFPRSTGIEADEGDIDAASCASGRNATNSGIESSKSADSELIAFDEEIQERDAREREDKEREEEEERKLNFNEDRIRMEYAELDEWGQVNEYDEIFSPRDISQIELNNHKEHEEMRRTITERERRQYKEEEVEDYPKNEVRLKDLEELSLEEEIRLLREDMQRRKEDKNPAVDEYEPKQLELRDEVVNVSREQRQNEMRRELEWAKRRVAEYEKRQNEEEDSEDVDVSLERKEEKQWIAFLREQIKVRGAEWEQLKPDTERENLKHAPRDAEEEGSVEERIELGAEQVELSTSIKSLITVFSRFDDCLHPLSIDISGDRSLDVKIYEIRRHIRVRTLRLIKWTIPRIKFEKLENLEDLLMAFRLLGDSARAVTGHLERLARYQLKNPWETEQVDLGTWKNQTDTLTALVLKLQAHDEQHQNLVLPEEENITITILRKQLLDFVSLRLTYVTKRLRSSFTLHKEELKIDAEGDRVGNENDIKNKDQPMLQQANHPSLDSTLGAQDFQKSSDFDPSVQSDESQISSTDQQKHSQPRDALDDHAEEFDNFEVNKDKRTGKITANNEESAEKQVPRTTKLNVPASTTGPDFNKLSRKSLDTSQYVIPEVKLDDQSTASDIKKKPKTCSRLGCGKDYNDNNEACFYHPGPPVFQEELKGWKCCGHYVDTLEKFVNILPCTTGKHSIVNETSTSDQELIAHIQSDLYKFVNCPYCFRQFSRVGNRNKHIKTACPKAPFDSISEEHVYFECRHGCGYTSRVKYNTELHELRWCGLKDKSASTSKPDDLNDDETRDGPKVPLDLPETPY